MAGNYGLVPVSARSGDKIWVFFNAKTRFVLRRAASSAKEYSLVGECFALGIMDGEITRQYRERQLAEEALTLV
jgi:hypothetical protein